MNIVVLYFKYVCSRLFQTFHLKNWVVHVEDAGEYEAHPVEAGLPWVCIHLIGDHYDCDCVWMQKKDTKYTKIDKKDAEKVVAGEKDEGESPL